jgi:LCP family protein required for cell wall assembly
MSDGEVDATPGRRRPPRDSQPATPATLSAAPWERFSEPPADESVHRWQIEPPAEAPEDASVEPAEPVAQSVRGGSHASGALSVADLIAKVGANSTGTRHRRAALDDEPAEPEPPIFFDLQDTQVIETPAYSLDVVSEVPNLEFTHYPDNEEPELDPAVEEETEARPVKPKRIRRPKSARKNTAPKQKSHRRPLLVALRSMAALCAGIALVLTGGAYQWSASKNHRLNVVNALDPDSGDIVDPGGQYGDEDFLIVGMDSRSGENADMGAGDTEDAGGARSDTVMLVNIPANRKRVVAVSFPRDLAITPLQCEAWNPETHKYGPLYDEKTKTWGSKNVYTETKLNSAFAFGGPKCLVKEIQKLSGLSINRFIAVDFSGFAKMVEALGGVEVCSKTPLHDYELGTVLEHSGRQRIDGPTALNYVRARQVTTEFNGDYGRIKRQQLFLSSLLRSLISEDTLTDLNKLNNVVNMFISNSYVDNVQTKDLVQLGRSLQGMAAGHFTFVTVPTGVTDQNGDEPPRTADMKALFNAIINDDPLPEENDQNAVSSTPTSGPTTAPTTKKTPPPSAAPEGRREQVTTTSPDEVTVRVSNATAQSGLAATATSQLKHSGFNVMSPDDYPSSVNATTVFFSPGNEQAAATVASAFANSKVARVSGYGQVVQVVLGPDFKSVSAPAPSGSSLSVQIDHGPGGSTPTKLPDDLTVTNAADTTCE